MSFHRHSTFGCEIADIRAYERERQDFRARVIALKQRRRVSVGPHITFVFENSNPKMSRFILSELGMPFVRDEDADSRRGR